MAMVILTGPLRHAKPVSSHRWEENPSPISQSAILLSLALQHFCVAGNTYIPEGSPENQNLWEISTYTERGVEVERDSSHGVGPHNYGDWEAPRSAGKLDIRQVLICVSSSQKPATSKPKRSPPFSYNLKAGEKKINVSV